MKGPSGYVSWWALIFAGHVLAVTAAHADCSGQIRKVNPEEVKLSEWVDTEFPTLVHVSSDYVLDTRYKGGKRNVRCLNTANEPYYLSRRLQFSASGSIAKEMYANADDMAAKMKKIVEDMQKMQQSGRPMDETIAEMNERTEALERQNATIRARSRVNVESFFNSSSANCKGEKIKITAASVACIGTKNQRVTLYALFGKWQQSTKGALEYEALFTPSLPTHVLQTIALRFDSDKEALDKLISNTDWSAIASRLGR